MKFKQVDLFELERRKERRDRFLRFVVMAILAIVAVSFGDDAKKNIGKGLGDDFAGSLTTTMQTAIAVVQYAGTAILAIMFITKVIPALTGGQKETNWWELIGIIAGVIILNTAPTVFKAVTGYTMF